MKSNIHKTERFCSTFYTNIKSIDARIKTCEEMRSFINHQALKRYVDEVSHSLPFSHLLEIKKASFFTKKALLLNL
jgi:hypothetical protein